MANLHTLLSNVRDLFLFTEFYLIEAHLFFITRALLHAYMYTQNNLSCSAIVQLRDQGPCVVEYYLNEWEVLKHSLTRLPRKWPLIKELLSHKICSSALRKRTYHVGNGIHIYFSRGDGSGYLFNNVKVVGMIFLIFDAGKKKRHLLDSGNLCPCFSFLYSNINFFPT